MHGRSTLGSVTRIAAAASSRRGLCCASLLLAGALVGCGEAASHKLGEVSTDELGPIPPVVGLCSQGAQLELIDDMEDGGQAILTREGRAGSWFTANDETGNQVPRMSADVFSLAKLEPPRDGSHRAVHTQGQGFTDWGALVGFDISSTDPYDASKYGGIAFWARIEPGTDPNFRVNVTDVNTSQYGMVCDRDCPGPATGEVSDDGICEEERGPCHDYFGADLSTRLSPEWTLFTFPWDRLQTENWSNKNLTAIVTSAIYGMRFQVRGHPADDQDAPPFDFWLDDVAFLCK